MCCEGHHAASRGFKPTPRRHFDPSHAYTSTSLCQRLVTTGLGDVSVKILLHVSCPEVSEAYPRRRSFGATHEDTTRKSPSIGG